jgi:predicted RNase H-like HicB family nuclease
MNDPDVPSRESQMAKCRATFLKHDKWWIGWTDDVPGALTQRKTLQEAEENLRDAIALMLEDVDTDNVPEARPDA